MENEVKKDLVEISTETFADAIMELRGALLISQVQLAHELKICAGTVNRWEKGHCEPSFLLQSRLANFCKEHGIELHWKNKSEVEK